ncbi:MAG: SpoIIIAH-like family protein [Bacillus sp. (in: firmicutes)]
MLLKKQTVWLLTMLSLVIVLSVYYVTTPVEEENNMANTVQTEEKQQAKETTNDSLETENVKTEEAAPSSNDETLEMMRMDVTDERNRMIEELTAVLSNTELSSEERDEASETIKQIRELNVKEDMLESLIVSFGNNEAALVRTDGNEVKVTVKAPELSKSAANDIVRLVSEEMPTVQNVTVEIQPTK